MRLFPIKCNQIFRKTFCGEKRSNQMNNVAANLVMDYNNKYQIIKEQYTQ